MTRVNDSAKATPLGPFPRAPRYGASTRDAVTALLDTGRLSETGRGPATTAIENAFAELTDTRYALSLNSGTAALHAALHAAGAGPDRGVAVSPMTWISALTAIFHAGSYPLFHDVEENSPVLSPDVLPDVAGRCGAVLVTHAWGTPAAMEPFLSPDLPPVVEDCSHAHGAIHHGRPVGSWGVAGCFSLQESKAVSGGEGGILTTSDRGIYERAMTLGHHPHRLAAELTDPDLVPLIPSAASYKFRMPALSAVIAREDLRGLAARNLAAQNNWQVLHDLVGRHGLPIAFPELGENSQRGWYGTPLILQSEIDRPDDLQAACVQAGIPVRAQYPDWLASPLLQSTELLTRFWPHVAHTDYRPASRADLPHYDRLRRQLLVLKIPDVPAPDYMEQVGHALAAVLLHFPAMS